MAEGLARPGLLELITATDPHGSLEPARARRNLERFLGWAPNLPPVPALAWAQLRQRRAFQDPGDAPAENAAADLVVQTIHGAKGLEYEDVILPMLADRVKGVRKGTVRQRPHQGHELWIGWKLGKARGPVLRELRSEEERRSFREGLNLLYVGLTRARDRMILLQQWPEKEGLAEPPTGAIERRAQQKSVCWQHVATDLACLCPDLLQLGGAPPAITPGSHAASSPLGPPTLRDALSRIPEPPSLAISERARRGIQIHTLLREILVRDALDPRGALAYLANHPLLRIWPEAEAIALGVLRELRARGLAELPRRTEFELEGAGRLGGGGRADLVIWAPDRRNPSRIILVDFKLAAEFSEDTLELHRLQLLAYREALLRQAPNATVETWVVGLEGGGWVALFPDA